MFLAAQMSPDAVARRILGALLDAGWQPPVWPIPEPEVPRVTTLTGRPRPLSRPSFTVSGSGTRPSVTVRTTGRGTFAQEFVTALRHRLAAQLPRPMGSPPRSRLERAPESGEPLAG